ncbi:MAG: NADH-quinone oxidoreductase subunit L [Proteobacteria bacterium]|jgi:NADH-quinone oxidoreductase subunit L|nr:NADH-quinone oxidoreductase subunit L [Pseudomonadota bacterium]
MEPTLSPAGYAALTILLLPLAAAVIALVCPRRDPESTANRSIGAIALGFVLSLGLFAFTGDKPQEANFNWLSVGDLHVAFGLLLDPLSKLMLLIVTGVGLMIHIYSRGYLHGDRSYSRYFASLSLFTFSMLGIVLANNLFMMFVFWELVGVSSYLLIGFWFEKGSAADAAKKAFLTNRVGDFGFILGIILTWAALGSVNFTELAGSVELGGRLADKAAGFSVLAEPLGKIFNSTGWWIIHPNVLVTLVGLLLFMGAMGKSAQFPLHVWLPDAMEGPTPVSALIHAATMVAAGVFMLCRIFFLLNIPGSHALEFIAWIGGFTALLAALMALQQNDIKRILAYSTLSQLGYMVMAVGLHAPGPAMFHLTTHAAFKALLFLGAGSVIYACHHEQDIWKMGGLRETMPRTWWTFRWGTLALCGVWPFAGFFSKDAILASALEHNNIPLFVLGVFVAGLTTFYMSRLVLVAFCGQARSESAGHAHESPGVMTWPLVVLAVPTLLAGAWGIDAYIAKALPSEHPPHDGGFVDNLFAPFNHNILAAVFGLLAVVAGYKLARALYANAASDPLPGKIGFLANLARDRFYFDELYGWFISVTQETLAKVADWMDRWIIAGLLVRGTHGTTELVGRVLRLAQTGSLQTYAFLFAAGVVLVLAWQLVLNSPAH